MRVDNNYLCSYRQRAINILFWVIGSCTQNAVDIYNLPTLTVNKRENDFKNLSLQYTERPPFLNPSR